MSRSPYSRSIPRHSSFDPRSGNSVLDFDVQRFTRVCAQTGRELTPGDVFYSVLLRDGADVVRRDIFVDAWEGPPEDCLGWWKSEVPDPKSRKMQWAPHDVMLHYFADTEDKPDQKDVRYVLTLLMIRRRIFRLEETETMDDGREEMILFCPRTENEHRVEVVPVSQQRAQEIQELLAQLLVDAGGN